jgi:hypothetical protein
MKNGDWVIRIKDSHVGMIVGDIAKVGSLIRYNEISLEGYRGTHSKSNLRVATPEEIEARGFKLTSEPLIFN